MRLTTARSKRCVWLSESVSDPGSLESQSINDGVRLTSSESACMGSKTNRCRSECGSVGVWECEYWLHVCVCVLSVCVCQCVCVCVLCTCVIVIRSWEWQQGQSGPYRTMTLYIRMIHAYKIHTYIYTYIHTYIHTYIQYIHTYVCIYICMGGLIRT